MALSNRDLYAFLHRWARDQVPGALPTRIMLRFSDGSAMRLRIPLPDEARASGDASACTASPAPAGRRHSADFCSVRWDGRLFFFTPNQAAIVKALWQAMENGTPCVQGATLLEAADCESSRVSDVFRGSDAWGVLIVEGAVKGAYQLAEPTHG